MLYTTVGSNGERANDFQSTCARPLASGDRPQSPPPDHTGGPQLLLFFTGNKTTHGRASRRHGSRVAWTADRNLREEYSAVIKPSLDSGSPDILTGNEANARVWSNQILFAQNTSHLNAASGKTVNEQGQQGSKEYLQRP